MAVSASRFDSQVARMAEFWRDQFGESAGAASCMALSVTLLVLLYVLLVPWLMCVCLYRSLK